MRRWRDSRVRYSLGPEYNFLILLMVVLACLVVLAMIHWWLGVIGIVAIFVGLVVAGYTA